MATVTAASIESNLLAIRTQGYCVIEGIIEAHVVSAMCERITAIVEREDRDFPYARKKIGYAASIINHDQSFATHLVDDRLTGLAAQLLGEHFRISFTAGMVINPGNERGAWHADWPFNQGNAGRILAPYPDGVFHLTTIWMLSPFTAENGATLVLPGSHRLPSNPTAERAQPHPSVMPGQYDPIAGQMNVAGSPGSVLVMDSRLWHATAANLSERPRVALIVRYAPWWLNLAVLNPDSDERRRICDEAGRYDNVVPLVRREVYDSLPASAMPLFRHWVGS